MTTDRPNIVFVLTDDQGYGDLGCTGNDLVRTPNIDRFHDQSIRFTDYHVGPTCAPTRAGLFTGHYANSTGVWHTIGGRSLLREAEWTLPQALRESGYATGLFGKWHLGDATPYRPHERGFGLAVYHGGGGITQVPDYWGNDYFDDTYFVNGEPRRFSGYCTDVFFDEAKKFIHEHRDEPFFAMIATNAPHTPLNVDRRYVAPYLELVPERRARFYGMIQNIDENFGGLMSFLDEEGLAHNTIVIFMTDNGSASGCEIDASGHVTDGYNAGMRGMKNWPYDGGHRVPFFLRLPEDGIPRDVNALTANIDVMPTLLDLCGVNVPADRPLHGRSLVPLLAGSTMLDQRTVVTDSQRLPRPVKWRKSAVMRGSWRLVNGVELYDVAMDPGQRRNIAFEHPELVGELRAEYEVWWSACSAQFDRETPIAIGSTRETVLLTGHDWRIDGPACGNHVVFRQAQIRDGVMANGRWEIDVRIAGVYQVELRRWPRESGHRMCAGIEGDDIEFRRDAVDPRALEEYSGGRGLNLALAIVRIGSHECSSRIWPDDDCARFEMELSKGRSELTTWLLPQEDRGDAVRGAYYAYITRVG